MTHFADVVVARSPRRRVPLELLWEAFADASPVDAAATDRRRRLADALEAGERHGTWTRSKKVDGAGRPPLPAFVTLAAAEPTERADPAAVAWRPELAWAARLRRLSTSQLELLTAVNAFLRDGGSERPLVPSEERSLELFDDEKVISGRVGGTTLWGPERLSPQLLRCVPSTTPFAYERVGDGHLLLVVENQATFATVRDLLRQVNGHPYAATVFGSGRSAAATIGYLTELPFVVTGVDYFGDLDVDGLEAAAACLDAARRCGVSATLHRTLWRLLLAQRPTSATSTATEPRIRAAVEVLPTDLRPAALQILTSGQRIAQERCSYDLLTATPMWWQHVGSVP